MTKSRKERLKDAKIFFNDKKDLSLIELRNIYKKRYHVDNICSYRELALLGISEAKIKIDNIERTKEARKQKKLNEKLKEQEEDEELIQELEFLYSELIKCDINYLEETIECKECDDDLPF